MVVLLDLVKRGYRNANDFMVTAFYMLCKEAELSEDVFASLATLSVQHIVLNFDDISSVRTCVFQQLLVHNCSISVTRVHLYVWHQASISHHIFLDALDHVKFLMHLRLYGIAA